MYRTTTAVLFTTLALVSITGSAQAKTATQFEQLKERLLNGKPTTSITDLSQCTSQSGKMGPKFSTIGGFSIDAFQVKSEPAARISYAHKHLTVMDDGTPVIEFLQYRVFQNDTATFKVTQLSPVTYKPLPGTEPMLFDCPLGVGLHFVPNK
ncbi:VirK family protein [Serratia fonticola]|uniref:VirK family protein n=1 Tax=Serratia fonticola TaxID=47917 RepID=UPI00301DB8E8